MTQEKIKIGYIDNSYSSDRNFLNLNPDNVHFSRIYDFTITHRVLRKMGIKYRFGLKEVFSNYYQGFKISSVDLVHLYNRLSLSDKPWVTTYETRIPYWTPRTSFEKRWYKKYGVNQLKKESCKKIIAISQNAYDLQCAYMEKENAWTKEITDKMTVLHPAQELIVPSWEEKNVSPNGPLKIIIVGHQFYIKGGNELLQAFDQLVSEGADIELTIVSSLLPDTDSLHTSREDIEYANKIIDKYGRRITHHTSLPNDEVLQLFKKSHLSILSSYSETYGFSVLEAQAAGCPVVTTDIRVFPENNNDDCGWMIRVPQYDDGYGIYGTKEQEKQYSDILVTELKNIFTEILNNPSLLRKKGNNAIERIRQEHDPTQTAAKLFEIYKHALADEAVPV